MTTNRERYGASALRYGYIGVDRDNIAEIVAQHTEPLEALLVEAASILKALYTAGLTVKPTLDKPYDDNPNWTPWTRWVGRPCEEAHELRSRIKKALPGQISDDPSHSRPLHTPGGRRDDQRERG